MYQFTSGASNTVVGRDAGSDLTTGSENTALGHDALANATSSSNNTALGMNAGISVTTGHSNVFLGVGAGQDQISTGQDQCFIARSNDAAGNATVWLYGGTSGQCIQGNNSSSWTTTSDRRLKKDITNNTVGLDAIDQLRVTNFKYRTEDEIDMSEFPLAEHPNQVVLGKGDEGVHTGVIAQEIEEIIPECIKVSERGAKTVSTDPILWALVNAVKELSAKNTALETRVAALEAA